MHGTVRKKRRGMHTGRLALVARLRAEGCTRVEIGRRLHAAYGCNMLRAMRLAHGWSQPDAAAEWRKRWPDDGMSIKYMSKNISYWEMWPAATGYTPSLHVLARLAELYQCAVSDLTGDHADFRHLDPLAVSGPAVRIGRFQSLF